MNHVKNTMTYEEAKDKAERVRGFYIHLTVYILVNSLLCFINLTVVPEFTWFLFPLGGWGIGLAAHALATFVIDNRLGHRWMDKKIKQYME